MGENPIASTRIASLGCADGGVSDNRGLGDRGQERSKGRGVFLRQKREV